MIFNNVVLRVLHETDIDSVSVRLTELARLSAEEPGCERFEVYHSQVDSLCFLLVEQWSSQKDLDLHREAPAFKALYIPEVLPLVTREAHPSSQLWPE